MSRHNFTIKDSGEREEFDSGMVRDTEEGKIDYTYVVKGPMLDRWAEHLRKGAKKYKRDNWMQGDSIVELERFRRSAFRHFIDWIDGKTDEDHAAAVLFNINGAEYVAARMMNRTLDYVRNVPGTRMTVATEQERYSEYDYTIYSDQVEDDFDITVVEKGID